MCRKEGHGLCECVFERVSHALSIKRIEGDHVARQLRATIVWRDNSGPESALSSLSLCLFHFLSPSLSHTHTHTLNLITAFKMIFTKMASATGNRLLIHTVVFSTF